VQVHVAVIAVCALPVKKFSMIGDTVSHYGIIKKPGGEMGVVVYRAHDEHLDRKVAIEQGCERGTHRVSPVR